ncbi:MAG: S9 family peptidase [Gammaproteobacteria bacterium]
MSTLPYGSWPSPITAALLVGDTVGLSQLWVDHDDLYWIESRPAEGGRNVIVRQRHGAIHDVLPAPYNARTRVHEYGGGAYTAADGVVYFAHDDDQRMYRLAPGAQPEAITPPGPLRYADFAVDRHRQRLLCVCEDHGTTPPTNTIVAIDLAGRGRPLTLIAGDDFYAAPRVSHDGRRLAWLSWNHPDMPWDAAALHLTELDGDGRPTAVRRIAGGAGESVFQPTFAPDDTLYFVSDKTGWWNLYRLRDGAAQLIAPMAAELGVPQWVFGQTTYAYVSTDTIIAAANVRGEWRLIVIDTRAGTHTQLDVPYVDIAYVQACAGGVVFIGATPTAAPAVVRFDLALRRADTVRSAASVCLEPGFLSRARPLTFATSDGEQAHAFFYPPRNHDVDPPQDARPPLLVMSHGGPTAMSSAALNLKIQYWTSRGIAVLDVNYRGSTGFGRAYRERLYGAWGIADVEDCVHGARFLVQRGDVDGAHCAIRGGSAGGFTTLCALTFHSDFAAGASYYGVSDLEALAHDTHKFEARYLDRLVGPYPAERERYRARSPIHAVERLARPMIFFQGLEDRVVPPDQTERMVAALRARQVPVAYLAFAGEAHGFRRADTIRRALEAELYFYGRLFGFTPADRLEPVPIEHWPE